MCNLCIFISILLLFSSASFNPGPCWKVHWHLFVFVLPFFSSSDLIIWPTMAASELMPSTFSMQRWPSTEEIASSLTTVGSYMYRNPISQDSRLERLLCFISPTTQFVFSMKCRLDSLPVILWFFIRLLPCSMPEQMIQLHDSSWPFFLPQLFFIPSCLRYHSWLFFCLLMLLSSWPEKKTYLYPCLGVASISLACLLVWLIHHLAIMLIEFISVHLFINGLKKP